MKKILLLFAVVSFVGLQSTYAQSHVVRGKVVDSDGQPVIGAEVKQKNGTISVQTDENGNYEIELPEGASFLVIESVSGNSEVPVDNSTAIQNVTLSQKTNAIGEISVYGRKIDKRTYTGALTTVTAEQIAKRPVTDIARAIEGAAPGVSVSSGGGQPGAAPDILMRGIGSIGANNAPLIVLDGAPYSGALSSINPVDVETMTFLKDATATALYGSRGANGVIVIMTKRGNTKGKPRITIDASVGVLNRQMPPYETLGVKDYYEVAWDAYTAEGTTTKTSEALIQFLGGYNAYNVPSSEVIDPVTGQVNPNASLAYTDSWQDELSTVGLRQNYSLSVANGDDKDDYLFSIGYNKDNGIVKNSMYDRFTTRLNVNTTITRWLKSGISLAGTMDNQQFFVGDNTAYINPFFTAQVMGPIYPVYRYDAQGNRMYEADGVTPLYDFGLNDANNPAGLSQERPFAANTNAVAALFQDDRSTKALTGFGRIFLEATFLKDFTFTPTFVINYYNGTQNNFQNSKYGDAANVGGRFNRDFSTSYTWTFNQLLSWNPSFGPFQKDKGHHLNVSLLHEAYFLRSQSANFTRTGFPGLGFTEAAAGAVGTGSSSQLDYQTIESYMGMFSYDYQGKYYLNANIRRDGTSRFSPESRWGNFGSVGLGWMLSEESFLKSANWLSLLKVRGSYGFTGQQDLGQGYYVWQSRYDFNPNNTNPGYTFTTWGNRDLQWESRLQANVGFDASFVHDRYNISVDYFNNGSKDMLFARPLAPSTGVSSIPVNVGDMVNKGVEIAINAVLIKSKKPGGFTYDTRINLTHLRNKLTKVQGEDSLIGGGFITAIGLPVNSFFLPRYAGVDIDGQALYYFKDGTTTTDYAALTREDYVYAGNPIRDLEGSWTNNFSYKGFQLTFMLSFGVGGKFYDNTYASLMSQGISNLGQAWHVDMLKAWKEGDPAEQNLSKDAVPRASFSDQYATSLSDRFLVSNNFLNLKNINFSYNLPDKWLKGAFQSAKIYVSMDNVYYLSKRKGLDLNQSLFGTSSFSYYNYKTVMFGVNFGL